MKEVAAILATLATLAASTGEVTTTDLAPEILALAAAYARRRGIATRHCRVADADRAVGQ
jgi:hypothetical protein